MIGIHEGAGAVIDGFTGHARIVRVHDAVDEADTHPARDELRLRSDDRLQEIQRRLRLGVVARDDVIGKRAQRLVVPAHGEILERADADVARGDPGEHRAGKGASRTTVSPVVTAARARVVGTPSAAIASETMYSRITGPSQARPSPIRENGVLPAPFSWMSRRRPSRSITSPRRIARPSPSCGTNPPNWWPA